MSVCLSVCLSVSLCRGAVCLSLCVCVCLSVSLCGWVGGCVGVVSVKIKRPALPPCAVDGRSRNPICLYIYIYLFIYLFIIIIIFTVIRCRFPKPPVD